MYGNILSCIWIIFLSCFKRSSWQSLWVMSPWRRGELYNQFGYGSIRWGRSSWYPAVSSRFYGKLAFYAVQRFLWLHCCDASRIRRSLWHQNYHCCLVTLESRGDDVICPIFHRLVCLFEESNWSPTSQKGYERTVVCGACCEAIVWTLNIVVWCLDLNGGRRRANWVCAC